MGHGLKDAAIFYAVADSVVLLLMAFQLRVGVFGGIATLSSTLT